MEICLICHKQINRRKYNEFYTLKCTHIFHEECLEKFFDNNLFKCPTCNIRLSKFDLIYFGANFELLIYDSGYESD